jgi:hypothetical protein
MNATFTNSMIQTLRDQYGKIQSVDPDGKSYAALTAFLDKQSPEMLKALVDAKIKWVSSLALNRL